MLFILNLIKMESKKLALIVILVLIIGITGGYYLSEMRSSGSTMRGPMSSIGGGGQISNQNSTGSVSQEANQASRKGSIDKGSCLSDECLSVDGLEYPAGTLSEAAQKALVEAINDEYKAYSVYEKTMAKLGNIRPFSMIIRAEESHIASLKAIFDKYGIKIPVNTWQSKVQSEATLAAACKVGVEAEIENAKLYREKLLPAVKDYADITQVFTNLMNASQEKHLPAFERCSQ